MENTIDLYLISGFLGAGKTTFLQKFLTEFTHKKIGVLVNEFGDIGIDGQLIERNGIQLVEINRGSIFCSCLKGGFVKTLLGFSKEDIDLLVIENSGMADPSSIHRLLKELDGKVGRPYHYRGAVCLLDAVSFLRQVRVLNAITNQIKTSHFVIVNKTDLVNERTILAIEDKVREINPDTYIYRTIYGSVPGSILEQNLRDNGFDGESVNQTDTRFDTMALECRDSVEYEKIKEFGEFFKGKVLRLKGIIRTDEGWIQLDVVNDQLSLQKTALQKKDVIEYTKLVLIQSEKSISRQDILLRWKDVTGREGILYE